MMDADDEISRHEHESLLRFFIFVTIYHISNHSLWSGANVNGVTTSKDHSVLSLACAGGHTEVVQLLLAYGADPCQTLKVIFNSVLIDSFGVKRSLVINLTMRIVPLLSISGRKICYQFLLY